MRREGGTTLGIDTETSGLDILRDRVHFWSMATDDERWCFPVSVLGTFDPLFRRTDIAWALANAKFDMHMLANHGTKLFGKKCDIIVMDAMEDDTRPHGLKEQSWLAYEAAWGDFKELFLDPVFVAKKLGLDPTQAKAFRKIKNVGEKLLEVYRHSPRTVWEYASCDAFFTLMRFNDLRDSLANEELATEMVPGFNSLWDYFDTLEVPMTQCLWDMERKGIAIDFDYAKAIDEPMKNGLRGLKQDLFDIARCTFNPDSPDQLQWVLFDRSRGFGLKPVKYTKGGKSKVAKASTDKTALTWLSEKHHGTPPGDFLKKLIEYRGLKKLHGTYVVKVVRPDQKIIDPWTGKEIMVGELIGPDGRIHTRYNQAGARTSRLSSAGPNIQNIPRPDVKSDPYLIRGMFVAATGCELLDKDYPQIEFRMAAVLADEEDMIEDIKKGWDIHNANTANMFGIPYDDIALAKSKQKSDLNSHDLMCLGRRQEAKAVGLGTMFGEGVAKMAVQLNITVDRARELKNMFFDSRPNIAGLIDYMHEFAELNGFTYTMLGRKRRLHQIGNTDKRGIIAKEQRQAFNTIIQGSSAELIKLAMLRIHFDEEFRDTGANLLLSVHDELVAEAPKGDAALAADHRMHELMCEPLHWGPIQLDFPVPITPDGARGYRWSELH